MEIAPYDSLYSEESHPYTQALISAVPEPSTAPRKDRILLTGRRAQSGESAQGLPVLPALLQGQARVL